MIEDATYLIALANKLAAEGGLKECGRILGKIGDIDRDTTPKEMMAEIDEMHTQIHEHQANLRQILWDANAVIIRYKAPTN